MRIHPKPLDLSQFDHTAEQNGDADLARRLTRLVVAIEGSATILFEGGWGVGKSTFIRRWVSQLRGELVPSIYLDAFSVDYLETPFVAIAGAIAEAARAAKNDDAKYKKFVDAAARVGTALAVTAAKVGVKAMTLGAADLADLDVMKPAADALSDSLSSDVEGWVKERIQEHEKRRVEIASLRSTLSDLAKSLTDQEPTPRPLVVVIDELDRCRPDFALSTIEHIKHFFGTEGVIFVLVCNRTQLEASINHRYGSGVSSPEYLRKFYDIRVDYTLDYTEKHGTKLGMVIANLNSQLLTRNDENSRYVEQYVRDISRAAELSIRDVEQLYATLAIAYATEKNLYRPAIIVAFLSTLKLVEPLLFLRAKTGDLTYAEVEKFISGKKWRDFDQERLLQLLKWHLDPDLDVNSPEWRGFNDAWRWHLERLETIRFIANSIIDRFEVP